MRYAFVLMIAATLVLGGCSSSKASCCDATVQAPAATMQTVTARPVARNVENLPVASFAPPPAPEIPAHTTIARRSGAATVTPTSRPARAKAVPTSAKPKTNPCCDPCDPCCCPGGCCGIPDPCCPGGCCGIPDPCAPAGNDPFTCDYKNKK